MFAVKRNVKSTLLCGPSELSKSFMFEAAIYWAAEGRRVIYITPTPLESIPPSCHDRPNPGPEAFKLMRFMYLENYEALVERLVELHTFATLPSVLLIDDFDTYINGFKVGESTQDEHVAKTCSIILDTMNTCSRILKTDVYICAWSSVAMDSITTYTIYFSNIWTVTDEEDTKKIVLKKFSHEASTEKCPSYTYCKLEDGSRILQNVFIEVKIEEQNPCGV